jgi:hypothetical protein
MFKHGVRRLALVALAAWVSLSPVSSAQTGAQTSFARQVRDLSEPGGFFDTDNLMSNERSYLHVVTDLRQKRINGGAYVGVGPDQNFSYIAAVRPSVAYIIDVRRDNLLLHLLFKSLFAVSSTRVEYLSHLFGRTISEPLIAWRSASLEKIVAEIDAAPMRPDNVEALRARLDGEITRFGVPLSREDLAAISRFHRSFIGGGLALRFQTLGRAPRPSYPTYRDLLLETDRTGLRASFLASEDDFQFVRAMQQRDLIIPVVGNLGGPSAMEAIADAIKRRRERVSAFYVSNVEGYLFNDGVFPRYAENLAAFPRHERSAIIRSVFNNPGLAFLPGVLPGYVSASFTQSIEEFERDFAAGTYRSYTDLVAAGAR